MGTLRRWHIGGALVFETSKRGSIPLRCPYKESQMIGSIIFTVLFIWFLWWATDGFDSGPGNDDAVGPADE